MTKTDLPHGKTGGQLILLHTARAISGREFNALSFENRLALVREASGRRKYELLVEAPDAERLIRRLPAQEVFLLIKELGLPDVPELLAGVNTDQFTAFLDLDCWQGDLFDGRTAAEWLAVLFEAGEEKVLETMEEMEFPLLILLLKKHMDVLVTPGDFDDENDRSLVGQENAGYEIAYRDAETGKLIAAFLQVLQRHDPRMFVRLLESVRWEHEMELEEENYQERRNRLEALGFPDPFESRVIYAWTDPTDFDPAACRRVGIPDLPSGEAPAFILSAVPAGGLLPEVLAGGIDIETAWELTWLLNRVMIADRLNIGDVSQVREATGEIFRYLNLALEHLCGADVEQATRMFTATYPQSLFRLGFSLTFDLQRRARAIRKSNIGPWLDPPFRAFVDALNREKPRFFQGVEGNIQAGERPFATLRDLHLTGEWLDRLEAQERLFATKLPFEMPASGAIDLTGCVPENAGELTLTGIFLTALANRLLGRDFLPQPIPAAELAKLHALCRNQSVAELRKETVQWLEQLEPGAGVFGNFCLDIWEEDFCAIPPGEIDPRYIHGLIVRIS